jgi:L-asparaginase II
MMDYQNDFLPVVELTRGSMTESLHFGAIAVVDAEGTLLASYGNTEKTVFLRSTAKPLQAISFVENGGMERFGLTEEELSLMCASHSGTDHHAAVAASIQQKAGVSEDDLLCGVHPPMDRGAYKEMILRGEAPTGNRHQCSGKHSGMLANCKLHGFPIEDYINPDHPLQKMIFDINAQMWDLPAGVIETGIDGCSVPVFAVPVRSAAYGFARLCDPADLPEPRAAACRRITAAMTTFPKMVAGDGFFDTELMRAGNGRLVTKMGAEGFQSIGIMPGSGTGNGRGIGVGIKILDGDLRGSIGPLVAVEVLRQMNLLSPAEQTALGKFYSRPLQNWRGLEIGQIRPVFELEFQTLPVRV